MREPRRRAQDHGRLELLTHVQRDAHEAPRVLAVGRIETGELAEARVLAVILLVLRGEGSGIVGADQHQPALHAGVGDGHQAVGGDVDPHVLHSRQRPCAAEGRADGVVQRHLLVAGPLGANAGIAGEVLQDLRGRRAGIRRGVLHARLPGAQRDGFVTGKQAFHARLLL